MFNKVAGYEEAFSQWRRDGLLLNIVTGGGKTAVIAALIAWLRVAHDVQKFALLCPNLIVRDRLEEDFDGGKVFKDCDLLPDRSNAGPGDMFALRCLFGQVGADPDPVSELVPMHDALSAAARRDPQLRSSQMPMTDRALPFGHDQP